MKGTFGQLTADTGRKMDDKKIRLLTGNLIRAEEALKQLNERRNRLIKAFNELSWDDNSKSKNSEYIKQLQEEIYYLDESIKAYRKHADECKALLIKEQESYKKSIDNKAAREAIGKKILVKYVLPFVMLMLIFGSLFLLKPSITGQVILSKETTYNRSMNLEINQSGNYTLTLDRPADLNSIKATGSVTGNGTVKVYIEKDGRRYLIYKNK